MISCNILFDEDNQAVSYKQINLEIMRFGESYKDTIRDIILGSRVLDKDGKVFIRCASQLLTNFKMTRRGVFRENLDETLLKSWQTIGNSLVDIKYSIQNSNFPRGRYLLENSVPERETIINEIWQMTKALLPFTMSENSYGLVGASKILFSVLPELVLPTDNMQWKSLFKTVDLGDVIRFMADDITRWEQATGMQFDLLDKSRQLTTLPAVYNVIAMAARPENK